MARRHKDPHVPIIDAMPFVAEFANRLMELPEADRTHIQKLHRHHEKTRIRLQKLGSNKCKGFIVDKTTVVDGLTNRMKAALRENWNDGSCAAIRDLLLEQLESRDEYKKTMATIASNDRKNQIRCHFRTRDARKHGTNVHIEIYKCVLYILRRSGFINSKVSNPAQFRIDTCTKSCLASLLRARLIPISSEWPVFTTSGTGCATAIDLLCVDLNNHNEICVLELKTGNMQRALTEIDRGLGVTKMALAMLQCSLNLRLGRICYGAKFFDTETFRRNAVVFVRPWGAMLVYLPLLVYNTDVMSEFLKLLLERPSGSLRAALPEDENASSVQTSKNTMRKRRTKYQIGFKKNK